MFVKAEQVKQVEVVPGVLRRALGHGEEMLLCEFTGAAGSEVPVHTHPHAQVGYLVQGRMRLSIGDESETFKAGDGYYIAGGAAHGAVMLEDCIVVDVFCPPREDYLEG